jgi:uncharacterized membrane protein
MKTNDGMSLRAWLAGQALAGLAFQTVDAQENLAAMASSRWAEAVARTAVEVADAVLDELEKTS